MISKTKIPRLPLSKILKLFSLSLLMSTATHFILNLSNSSFNYSFAIEMFQKNTPAHLFSIALLALLYILISFIFNNLLISSLFFLILTAILTLVNLMKISVLNEPFFPSDLSFIGNIRQLTGMVNQKNLNLIILTLIVLVCLVIVIYAVNKRWPIFTIINHRKKKWLSVTLSSILLVAFLKFLGSYNVNDSNLRSMTDSFDIYNEKEVVHQFKNYHRFGFINGLILNAPGEDIAKPDNYTQSEVLSIMEKYQKIANQTNQTRNNDDFNNINLITVLSESLSDPSILDGLQIESPLSYITDPSDKVASGYLLSPVYGGGTPNTEYELITSQSIGSLSSLVSTAFQSFASSNDKIPSMIKNPTILDRMSVAIHSYGPHLYKRKQVYQTMGFDQQLFDTDMNHKVPVVEGSEFISDQSAYEEVLDLLRDSNSPMSIHLVTMQNHQSYFDIYPSYNYIPNSEIIKDQVKVNEIMYYAEGLSYTDRATKDFVDKLNEMDEPYILFLYGDHLSGLYTDILSKNDLIKKYTTNYFIASNLENVDLSIETGDYLSLTNVQNLLADIANVKVSAYQALVNEVNTVFSSIHREGFFLQGSIIPLTYEELDPHQQALVHEYNMIQYDLISGNEYSKDYIYFQQ